MNKELLAKVITVIKEGKGYLIPSYPKQTTWKVTGKERVRKEIIKVLDAHRASIVRRSVMPDNAIIAPNPNPDDLEEAYIIFDNLQTQILL